MPQGTAMGRKVIALACLGRWPARRMPASHMLRFSASVMQLTKTSAIIAPAIMAWAQTT